MSIPRQLGGESWGGERGVSSLIKSFGGRELTREKDGRIKFEPGARKGGKKNQPFHMNREGLDILEEERDGYLFGRGKRTTFGLRLLTKREEEKQGRRKIDRLSEKKEEDCCLPKPR